MLQAAVNRTLWWRLMQQYTRVHTRSELTQPATDEQGRPVLEHPWIGESLHPDEGYWLSRDYMYRCWLALCKAQLEQDVCSCALLLQTQTACCTRVQPKHQVCYAAFTAPRRLSLQAQRMGPQQGLQVSAQHLL